MDMNEETKGSAQNQQEYEVPGLPCEPYVVGEGHDTKADLAMKLRAEARRRAGIASRMRFGKTRACEFAYLAGLNDAAALIEGESLFLACPCPPAVLLDGYREDGTPLCDRDEL